MCCDVVIEGMDWELLLLLLFWLFKDFFVL